MMRPKLFWLAQVPHSGQSWFITFQGLFFPLSSTVWIIHNWLCWKVDTAPKGMWVPLVSQSSPYLALSSLQAGNWQLLISFPSQVISLLAYPYHLLGAYCWLRNKWFFLLFWYPSSRFFSPIHLISDYFYFFLLLLLLFFWYFLPLHLLILFSSCMWAADNLFCPHYLRLTIPPAFLGINHSRALGNWDVPKSSHYVFTKASPIP